MPEQKVRAWLWGWFDAPNATIGGDQVPVSLSIEEARELGMPVCRMLVFELGSGDLVVMSAEKSNVTTFDPQKLCLLRPVADSSDWLVVRVSDQAEARIDRSVAAPGGR